MDARLSSLTQIPCGTPVVVQEMLHDEGTRVRLFELGVMPGAEVRLVRRAPLGCPIEVEVGGARFSIRRELLDAILVGAQA